MYLLPSDILLHVPPPQYNGGEWMFLWWKKHIKNCMYSQKYGLITQDNPQI